MSNDPIRGNVSPGGFLLLRGLRGVHLGIEK